MVAQSFYIFYDGIGLCLVAIGLFFFKVPVAMTEIRPISTQDANQYIEFNSLNFFNIDSELFRTLFIEVLDDRESAEGLKKFKVVDPENTIPDVHTKPHSGSSRGHTIAASIQCDGTQGRSQRMHWLLVAEDIDEERWLEVLRYVNLEAQSSARNTVATIQCRS